MSYIELISLHVLEVQSNRVLSWVGLVDVAYSMRGQVDLTILLVGKLIFPIENSLVSP